MTFAVTSFVNRFELMLRDQFNRKVEFCNRKICDYFYCTLPQILIKLVLCSSIMLTLFNPVGQLDYSF
jgi:hypothetical protein